MKVYQFIVDLLDAAKPALVFVLAVLLILALAEYAGWITLPDLASWLFTPIF